MKRKHSTTASDVSTRAPKRRRSGTLERGFANLSLDAPMEPAVPIIEERSSPPRPSTPIVPEVAMKTSSWYEVAPHRIVITDLASYSEEDTDEDTPADASSPLISPALIERLKSQPLDPPIPFRPQPPSQALVLFRPLSSQIPLLRDAQPSPCDKKLVDAVDTDDAMDVEP
ncbi:hypothetical protein GGX14DRAFT_630499 [Mycena pura]|uniref:Uncharacterized protein n=1 Tax=Mycena pura TaxID=153505 RepID=A0AAD6VF01_9AGAR|nr:hypothetical protein GGX14DRAFT_630499 [Mycena pura]